MALLEEIGNHAQSSDIRSKVRKFICQIKIFIFARDRKFKKIVNGLLLLKLFQLSNGDFIIFVASPKRQQTRVNCADSELWAGCPNLGHIILIAIKYIVHDNATPHIFFS